MQTKQCLTLHHLPSTLWSQKNPHMEHNMCTPVLSPWPSLPVGLRRAGFWDLKLLRRWGSLRRCRPLHQSQHTHCRGQPAGWSPGGKDAGSQRSPHLHRKNQVSGTLEGGRGWGTQLQFKRSGVGHCWGQSGRHGTQLPLRWLGRWQWRSTTPKATKGPMEPAGLAPEGH